MATMSAETQAIIDRLKAEGDLIRNTGTNSLKSVRTEFAKFDGVFNSINANIAEQTSLMKAQLGIAEEAAEKVKTQEQLDELNNQRNTNSQQNQEARGNEDRLGDKFIEGAEKIGQQFTLKNMALLAAGGFITYNLLKGFITQGIEDNLLGMGDLSKSFSEFAKTDFKAIGDTITNMGPTLTSMQESMSTLAASVASLNEAIETITSISWGDIAETVLTSIGALTAYNQTMRFINRRAASGPGMRGGGRKALFRRLLAGGMTVATLGGIFGRESRAEIDAAQADIDDEARRTAQRNATDTIRAADKQAAEAAAAAAARTAASSVAPSVMSNAPTMQAPNILVETSGNTTRYRDGATGRYVAANQAVPQLNAAGLNAQGLPNIDTTTPTPRPPTTGSGRGNGNIEVNQRQADIELGKQAAEQQRSLIRSLAKSKIGKVVATAVPVVGLFAGLGFAGWNIIQGDFTSAALQLGSIPLPSVSGAALDLSSIGTEIFFAVAGETYNPTNPTHNALMEEIGKEVHAAYIEFMEGQEKDVVGRRELYDNQEANDLAAAERAQMGGAAAFSDSGYNPGIGNRSLGSNYYTGENVTLGSSSNFRGNYFVDKNGIVMFQDAQGNVMRAVDRPNFQNQLNNASGGANGTTIIHAPQNNVTAPVSVVDGGTQTSINSVMSMGGGGGGGLSLMPYGMTSGLVQ